MKKLLTEFLNSEFKIENIKFIGFKDYFIIIDIVDVKTPKLFNFQYDTSNLYNDFSIKRWTLVNEYLKIGLEKEYQRFKREEKLKRILDES